MRVKYLDFLKAVSITGVVIIHTVSSLTISFDGNSLDWWISHGYNSLVRWTVPMFFLISGALLLSSNKNLSLIEFYRTRVKKLFIPFFIWSLIYFYIFGIFDKYASPITITTFLRLFLNGNIFNRLWFFYSLLGLYMITPFIRIFVQNATKKSSGFLICLVFID